jgi:hypothetical protein
MSSYSNRQFNSGNGPVLRDYQHAARAFVDGDFALAPRLKFQHHVVISTLGGSNSQLSAVIKSMDTPKFAVTTETANQYNKKNVIMTGITYQPINIKFYDDNSGVARKVFEGWYSYTFGDHGAAKAGLYGKSLGPPLTAYGLENEPVVPFVNYIKIHTFAKRSWQGLTLVNPVIINWSHDTFNWTDTSPAEHTMTVAYDAVMYDSGNAGPGSPPNFGSANYDQTPSPLKSGSGGRSPALGVQTGVLNGKEQVFGNVIRKTDPTNAYKNPIPAADAANPNTRKQYNETRSLTLQGKANSTNNAAINTTASSSNIGRIGFNDANFPVYDSDTKTSAVQRKLTGL